MVESPSRAEKGKCPTLADGDHKIDFSLPARAGTEHKAGWKRGNVMQKQGED